MTQADFDRIIASLREGAEAWFNGHRIRELEMLIAEASRLRAIEAKIVKRLRGEEGDVD